MSDSQYISVPEIPCRFPYFERKDKLIKNWKIGDMFFAEHLKSFVLFLVLEEDEENFYIYPIGSTNGKCPDTWGYGSFQTTISKGDQPRGLYFVT